MSVVIPIISEFNAKGIERAKKEFAQLETSGQKAGFAVRKAALPAAAALSAVGAALFSSTKAAVEDAAAQTLLATNLKKTTGATDAQIAASEDWISVQGRLLGIADDDLRPALSQLAKATGSVTEAQRLVTQAMDISAATSKPLSAVVSSLEKAYGGNFKALQMLAPEYRNIIKDGASFETVMAKLATTTGGAATVAANTAEGQFKRFALALKETKESIGLALLPAINKLLPLLTAVGNWAQKNTALFLAIAGAIVAFAGAIVAARVAMSAWKAVAVVTEIVNWALAASYTAVQVATGIGIATALAGAAAFVIIKAKMDKARGAADLYAGSLTTVIDTQKQLNEYVGPVATRDLNKFKTAVEETSVVEDKATTKKNKLAEAARKLKERQKEAADAAKVLADALKDARDAVTDQFSTALEKANAVLADAKSKFEDFAKTVSAVFTGALNFKDAYDAGLETGTGFLDGLTSQVAKIKKFGELTNRLIAGGLSEAALGKVLEAGVDAGTAIADELLSGAGNILTANALVADATTMADKVGLNAANSFYKAGVDSGKALVAGIQSIIDKYTPLINAPGVTAGAVTGLGATAGAELSGVFDPSMLGSLDWSTIFQGITIDVGGLATLAQGGLVTSPTIALIGEGGQPEAVVPLDRMGEMGGGSSVTINVNGGDPNAVVDALRSYMRQNGSVPIRVSA